MTENTTPLVSIVIPTYNHAHFLGRALQSVLDQTYSNWEAIIIDNHSTDNTDEIMANYTDARFVYLKIHNNGVIAASRNAGIKAAKGEWIAFLDSDDWWTINKLQACFDSINDKVDLIYHQLEIVDGHKQYFSRKTIKSWQVKKPITIDLIIRGNAIATSSVIVRSELLRLLGGMSINTNMIGTEDYNTWLRLSRLTNKFVYLPKRLGFYQLHNQGISRKDMSIPTEYALTEFTELLNIKQQQIVISKCIYLKARFNYLSGDTITTRQLLRSSLKHAPFILKLKIIYMLTKEFIVK